MNWIRFARAPAVIRVDSEGAFKSHEFREWCATRGIEVKLAASEAQWQIGIVETRIRILKNQLHLMEDEFPEASIDELLEHCVAATVRRRLMDTVRYSGGLEPNVLERLKNMDLDNINQVMNDDWSIRQLPKQPLFMPTFGSPCVWPSKRDQMC